MWLAVGCNMIHMYLHVIRFGHAPCITSPPPFFPASRIIVHHPVPHPRKTPYTHTYIYIYIYIYIHNYNYGDLHGENISRKGTARAYLYDTCGASPAPQRSLRRLAPSLVPPASVGRGDRDPLRGAPAPAGRAAGALRGHSGPRANGAGHAPAGAAHVQAVRDRDELRQGVQGRDERDVWRRHHERHRVQHERREGGRGRCEDGGGDDLGGRDVEREVVSTLLYSTLYTLLYSTLLYSTLLYSSTLCSRYRALLYSALHSLLSLPTCLYCSCSCGNRRIVYYRLPYSRF